MRARASERRWALVAAVITTTFAVVVIDASPVGVFQDDGIYVILARALAEGEGYRYLHIPGAPNATHFPPLYPALLAALWKLFPSFPANVTLFKFTNALLLGVAAAWLYDLARRTVRIPAVPALVGVLAFIACAPVVLQGTMVLSEPLFLALLAPTLAVAERAGRTGRSGDAARAGRTGRSGDAARAGAAAVVLALSRTIGAVIVPALLLVLLVRRRWGAAAIVAAVACAGMLPWQLWSAAHALEIPPVYLGKYGPYGAWLAGAVQGDGLRFLAEVAWANMRALVALGWESTATDHAASWVRLPVTVAASFLFGLGAASLLRRVPVIATFTAAYLVIVLVWPFAPARFVWAIWPIVGIVYTLAALELRRVRRRARRRSSTPGGRRLLRASPAVGSLALAALAGGYAWYNGRLLTPAARQQRVAVVVADRARPLAEWVAANTAPSALVATDDDALIFLYTGRRAIPSGDFTPQEHLRPQSIPFAVERLRRIVRLYSPDYVLVSTEYGAYAARGLVQASPPELRLLGALRTGGVFAPVQAGGSE